MYFKIHLLRLPDNISDPVVILIKAMAFKPSSKFPYKKQKYKAEHWAFAVELQQLLLAKGLFHLK